MIARLVRTLRVVVLLCGGSRALVLENHHVVVLSERHLRRLLHAYLTSYQRSRTDLALGKDAPDPRPVQRADRGRVVAMREVGGLHHRYERRAA